MILTEVLWYTYRHSENNVSNVPFLLGDNIKDSKYIDIHVMHAICILKTIKQKKRIICEINCGSKYISTYRHSESKVFNVSYLPPDNIKTF